VTQPYFDSKVHTYRMQSQATRVDKNRWTLTFTFPTIRSVGLCSLCYPTGWQNAWILI